ncbi:hypothetical protein [Actinoplanes flavus]|uniref:Uncharacterized protein n=1 Tax=Actinoplanes flavus TaxID=2820290 RepID=A0ABS3UVE8_9ACTN|nr:hypothetical protein [Actinoplanes flavus]MBO3742573.1 hypothetical protein [Actinoplanes flavus]
MNTRVSAIMAGIGGAAVLAVTASPRYTSGPMPVIHDLGRAEYHGLGWAMAFVPVVVAVAALLLVRWWPYLLAAAWLMAAVTLPPVVDHPAALDVVLDHAPYPLAVVGVLGCAQGLLRGRDSGWGAMIAGLSAGAPLFAVSVRGALWLYQQPFLAEWHLGMLLLACVLLAPGVWRLRRGDPAAVAPDGVPWWGWERLRLPLVAGAATFIEIPLAVLSTADLALIFGVDGVALYRHPSAETAMIGAITLAIAAFFTALAGLWTLAGSLTAAAALVAVSAPMLLAISAIGFGGPGRWLGALAGLAIGAGVAVTRWRVPGAVTLAVGAATAVFIAHSATTGHPEKLAQQERVVPALILMVSTVAAGTAVFGAIAPALASRGVAPAALGPIGGVLAVAGLQLIQVTYREGEDQYSGMLLPGGYLTSSGMLLLVAAAGVAGIGLAHHLIERWTGRRRAEQIRKEAAEART